MIRRYSELVQYESFQDRFEYLKLDGRVGRETFGHDRHLNQSFYRSYEWKWARDVAIARDYGCDLGVPGYEIYGELLVHHMNPIAAEDILHGEEWILDPEYLITTTIDTHNAIHFGTELLAPKVVIERQPGDTRLW